MGIISKIINGAYGRIYKKYEHRRWIEFNPQEYTDNEPKVELEDVFFNIICKRRSYPERGFDKFIEVKSPYLTELLKRCLRFVVEIPDDYDFDEIWTEGEISEKYFVIGAQEVYVHLELLEAELSILRDQKNRTQDLDTVDGNSEHDGEIPYEDASGSFVAGAASHETSSQLEQLQHLLMCLETEFSGTKQKFNTLSANREINFKLL